MAVGRHQPANRPAAGRGDRDRRPDRRHARRVGPAQCTQFHSGRAHCVHGARRAGHELVGRGHQEPAAGTVLPGVRTRGPVRLQRSALLQHGGSPSSPCTHMTRIYTNNTTPLPRTSLHHSSTTHPLIHTIVS